MRLINLEDTRIRPNLSLPIDNRVEPANVTSRNNRTIIELPIDNHDEQTLHNNLTLQNHNEAVFNNYNQNMQDLFSENFFHIYSTFNQAAAQHEQPHVQAEFPANNFVQISDFQNFQAQIHQNFTHLLRNVELMFNNLQKSNTIDQSQSQMGP